MYGVNKCGSVGEGGPWKPISIHHSVNSVTMGSQLFGVSFQNDIGKWRGGAHKLNPAERAGLPDQLRDRTALCTDSHVDKEDAARAVDK